MTDSKMASPNAVRALRIKQGLTQAELAQRALISRSAVTAIEGQQLVPSVATALALAKVLGTTVEALFGEACQGDRIANWAWDPPAGAQSHWQAEVSGHCWNYPAESTPMLTPLPDGMSAGDGSELTGSSDIANQTLVVACCDPAAGLLASEYARATGRRMLIVQRCSRQSLELLREGKVHAAGLHLSTANHSERNEQLVRETLGVGYQLLRIAQWQEGIASAPGSRLKSVRSAVNSKLRWVGREVGSGARQCLDQILSKRVVLRRLARDHHGVAEAIRSGWADAGVCVQLTSDEAGLDFLPVQEENYDLCFPDTSYEDARIQSLLNVVRSPRYRRLLASLPGYRVDETGNLQGVYA